MLGKRRGKRGLFLLLLLPPLFHSVACEGITPGTHGNLVPNNTVPPIRTTLKVSPFVFSDPFEIQIKSLKEEIILQHTSADGSIAVYRIFRINGFALEGVDNEGNIILYGGVLNAGLIRLISCCETAGGNIVWIDNCPSYPTPSVALVRRLVDTIAKRNNLTFDDAYLWTVSRFLESDIMGFYCGVGGRVDLAGNDSTRWRNQDYEMVFDSLLKVEELIRLNGGDIYTAMELIKSTADMLLGNEP